MRISVCEFLRLTTYQNWFYNAPGQWMSDRGTFTAIRVNGSQFHLYKRGTYQETLTYYEGLTSNEARALNHRKRKARRKG